MSPFLEDELTGSEMSVTRSETGGTEETRSTKGTSSTTMGETVIEICVRIEIGVRCHLIVKTSRRRGRSVFPGKYRL
jgi:hypothetical protein